MKVTSIAFLSSAILLGSISSGLAADSVKKAQAARQGTTGSFAIWAQGLVPTGYEVNETYGARNCDDGGMENFCHNAFGIGGDARVHFPLQGQGLSIQLEGLGDWHKAFDPDDADDDENSLYGVGGAHIISRSGNMAFGAFGGISYSDHISEGEDSTSNHWVGGAEVASFLDNTSTLFAQIGYSGAYDGQDYVDKLVFGRVGARYFVSDHDRLEGWVGMGRTDTGEVGEPSRLNWVQMAANVERQLTASPLSVFAGYQGDHVDHVHDDDSDSYEKSWVHTFKLGIRYNFGESLKSEERNGSRTFELMNLRAPLTYADDLEPSISPP